MTVRELIERLEAFPEYLEVMTGPVFVSDVRDITRVVSVVEPHGGRGRDAQVVVVVS